MSKFTKDELRAIDCIITKYGMYTIRGFLALDESKTTQEDRDFVADILAAQDKDE